MNGTRPINSNLTSPIIEFNTKGKEINTYNNGTVAKYEWNDVIKSGTLAKYECNAVIKSSAGAKYECNVVIEVGTEEKYKF